MILDPGGIETFSSVLAAVMCHARIDQITDLFFWHQDPDVASSLGMWDEALPHARLHAPSLWEGFLRHFGCNNLTYVGIPDEGGTIALSHVALQLVPAHYLHSSGNIHLYDPIAKILFSGELGAALEPSEAPMFVDDFAAHVPKMTHFHERWMPSNRAKSDWIERVRELDIAMMVPLPPHLPRRRRQTLLGLVRCARSRSCDSPSAFERGGSQAGRVAPQGQRGVQAGGSAVRQTFYAGFLTSRHFSSDLCF